MELIFESRRNLSNVQGNVHFVQWQPEIHQEAVLRPDTFADGGGIFPYGTVLNEGGTLKMWYQCAPQDWPGGVDIAAVGYAESDDGYHWRKPPLGIVEHGPGDNHLCNLGLHSPSIFCDPAGPPSHRYRATGCGRPGFLARPGLRKGYYTAHSADGLHWQLDSPEPQWEGYDVITSIYHPGRHSGIIASKTVSWVNRMRRRCIQTATFKDGHYSERVSALYPDEYTDIAAAQRGHGTGDYYGMAMLPAGQSTVGFVWNFWHDLPYQEASTYGVHGHSDISLVFQEREGDRWLHVPGRPNFISHRDVNWIEKGWIYSSSTPVEIGGEHRLYFAGYNLEHFRLRNTNGTSIERWEKWIGEHAESGITFARWPKFRLFGFETSRDASFDLQLSGLLGPFELLINYKARRGGRVYASLSGNEAYNAAKSDDLYGDATAAPLTWNGNSTIIPPPSGEMQLTISLEMSAVYAYEVRPL